MPRLRRSGTIRAALHAIRSALMWWTAKAPQKRLRKVYASAIDAKAEATRTGRAKAKFEGNLGLGQPHIFPDTLITLTGFKSEIEKQKWAVAEATHTIDGSGGLTSRLSLETLASLLEAISCCTAICPLRLFIIHTTQGCLMLPTQLIGITNATNQY
jgi:hypothetical protein